MAACFGRGSSSIILRNKWAHFIMIHYSVCNEGTWILKVILNCQAIISQSLSTSLTVLKSHLVDIYISQSKKKCDISDPSLEKCETFKKNSFQTWTNKGFSQIKWYLPSQTHKNWIVKSKIFLLPGKVVSPPPNNIYFTLKICMN